jgi:hypothetical protein
MVGLDRHMFGAHGYDLSPPQGITNCGGEVVVRDR